MNMNMVKYLFLITSAMLIMGCSDNKDAVVEATDTTMELPQSDTANTSKTPIRAFIDYTCDSCKDDYNALKSTFEQVELTHKDTFDMQYIVYNLDNTALDIARGGECVRQEGLINAYLDTYFDSYYNDNKASIASEIATKIGANMDNWKVCMSSDTPLKMLQDSKLYARNKGITGVTYIQIADKELITSVPKRANELYNTILKAL